MKHMLRCVLLILLSAGLANGQSASTDVKDILNQHLQSQKVVDLQLRQFLMGRIPRLPCPSSAEQWTHEEQSIRRHILEGVIFHGWPRSWVDSAPKAEDLGAIPSGNGYHLRTLRYQVVPGLYTTALLYEPAHLTSKVPGVLSLMGHFDSGKAMEFEQKLSINLALRGMIVLNPEWLGMGELQEKGNAHWFLAHLDLVGANGVGLFYLAMRKALDILYDDPNVDRARIGVTGLSGGGWQTLMISSLDPRVHVAIPVAGYDTLLTKITTWDVGDIEQNATDFLGEDNAILTALLAPRPSLLIYNAEDNCCFRAPLVKPYVFDAIKPFFALYGKENFFQFYQNTSISAHNYGLDNRHQAYCFFERHFHLPRNGTEIPVGQDIKSYTQLRVGVPSDNLTILGLARRLAQKITRQPFPSDPTGRAKWSASKRAQLKSVVRYHAVDVEQVWPEFNTYHNQVESLSFRFEMSNGLSATGTWLKEVSTRNQAPMTIVLNDRGMRSAGVQVWDHVPEVADRIERGEQVVVLDLLFTGEAAPDHPSYLFTEMLAATGERPLGMEAAQLIALARWAQAKWHPPRLRLESTGIRSQVVALVASGLEPGLFPTVEIQNGMRSLGYLLQRPVTYQEAPDLFCLDLYKDFDLDGLQVLAKPTDVVVRGTFETHLKE